MKLSELIEKLQKIQAEYGDIETVVQYRDDGGDYEGTTDNIYCTVDTDFRISNGDKFKKVVVL